MSLVQDKKEVFKQVGVYDVLGELPDLGKLRNDALNSVKSKSKNLLPFMLDLLKALAPPQDYFKDKLKGKVNLNNPADFKNNNMLDFFNNEREGDKFNLNTYLQERDYKSELLEYIFTDTDRLNRVLKEGLIYGIKSGFACGFDFNIPGPPAPEIEVEIDKIDLTKLLTLDRSGLGGLYFGPVNRDLNTFIYDVVQNKQTNQVWNDNSGSPVVEVSYVSTGTPNPKLKLKIPDSRVGTSFFDWLSDYVNSTEVINYKGLMAEVSEFKSGIISKLNNIGPNTILDRLKTDKVIDRILDTGGEPTVTTTQVSIDDTFFSFTNEELTELEERSNYLSKGVEVVDLGCGLVEIPFNPQDLDPLKNLGPIEPTPQKKGEVINLVLDNISNTASSAGNPEDEQTGKDNFKINLIKQLPTIISRFVITPKVIGVYQLTAQTLNTKIKNLLSCFDFGIAAREFLKYVAIRILGIILEWLFIKIKKIIVDKIKNLIKFIIKEKITIYVNSIKSTVQSKTNSLTSGLNSKVGDISKSLYK